MEKKEIRKQIRELKRQYSLEEKKEKSVSVWKQIEQNENFKNARVILAYWSMDDEVFTHDFVCEWAGQKNNFITLCTGRRIGHSLFRWDR